MASMPSSKKYDLCVIGSGPAGMITALEFAKLNPDKEVILLEYGSEGKNGKNKLDDSIEITEMKNHHPVYECTNKGLGGTSATWGGRCVMYDPVDFEDRLVVKDGCTWDGSLLKELDPFLAKTAEYFECGKPVFDLDSNSAGYKPIAENFRNGDVIDSVVERWSMPTRFGSRFAGDIQALKNLTLYFNAEARNFVLEGKAIDTAEVLVVRDTQTGEEKHVHAKTFVIAAGTQETTRLLLRNPSLFSGIGGVPSSLGKYYQGHVSGKIASVKFYGDPHKTGFGFIRDEDGVYLRKRFQFSTEFLIRNDLLNTAIWLDNPLYHDPKHKSGAMSFMYLAMITPVLGKKLAPPAIAGSITKGKVTGIRSHLWNILRGLPASLSIPAGIFYRRYCLKRKLPGVFLYSPENKYALHFHAEQVPEESNRMELGEDGETLRIHYKLTDADVTSVIQLHHKLDEWLRQHKCGELEYWFPQEELKEAIYSMSRDGIHQSGTTRIASNPVEGVVDPDLRLFGTSNVFICSSSVFPTSGQANPTFLLGAFAVRLAHHLTKVYHEKN